LNSPQILEQQPSNLSRENFSFSARAIVGSFLQPAPPPYANDGEYIRMTDEDVAGSGGGSSSYKEGRPRNLGRGVSKPKKNTVASLLAQSRAVGLKPMLATQQLLQQGADIVS